MTIVNEWVIIQFSTVVNVWLILSSEYLPAWFESVPADFVWTACSFGTG